MNADWEQYQLLGEQALLECDFGAAELYWRAAYEQAKTFERVDPRVAATLEALAESLFHQGKLDEAEPLCREILDIFATTRGPDHPDVGVTANNLAMLYRAKGRYAEAEPLYKQAIAILASSLGSDHADVVNLRMNYAELLKLCGKPAQAEELLAGGVSSKSAKLARSGQFQALEMEPTDNLLDTQPIDVDSNVDSTWEQYRASAERALRDGDYVGAETMWLAALKKAQHFGEYDPRLCTTLESLAEVLWKQAKYADAQIYCRRTLDIYEKILGGRHPDVGIVANNLAMLHHAQNDYGVAEQYYKQALPIRFKALGADHPAVINLVWNYSHLLAATGRPKEAEKIRAITSASSGRWTRSGTYRAISFAEAEKLHGTGLSNM